MEQRSDEWFKCRLGNLTASRVKDAIDTLKNGKPSEKRKTYMFEIIAERLTQQPIDKFQNKLMQWGTENEPLARAVYELHKDVVVQDVGFIDHPSIKHSGASPDGLIGDDGLLEIKCPSTMTHIKWVIDGVVPDEHKPQMLWQMACTGRRWCDFVSYDPRLADDVSLFVRRFTATDDDINAIEKQAIAFLYEVNKTIEQLVKAVRG